MSTTPPDPEAIYDETPKTLNLRTKKGAVARLERLLPLSGLGTRSDVAKKALSIGIRQLEMDHGIND